MWMQLGFNEVTMQPVTFQPVTWTQGSGLLPSLLFGEYFLTDESGAYLADENGNYLIGKDA